MPRLMKSPTVIPCEDTKPKDIREFAGRANSQHKNVTIAQGKSPIGWSEPGQIPGQWFRYGIPYARGAQYGAVCLSAFSPETFNRDSP